MEKYYRILGLGSEASLAEVKKAYRKLALRYHPDLKSGNEEYFKSIVEAYEMICSHLNSRRERKQMGEEELRRFYELLKKAAEEKAREKAFENAARRRAQKAKEQDRAYRTAIYSFLGLVLILLLAYNSYFWLINWQISRAPGEVIATVTGIERNRVLYSFTVQDSIYEERKYVRGSGISMFSKAGMPLKIGDQFRVQYSRKDPFYHRLDTYATSSQTFQRYLKLATDALRRQSLDPLKPNQSLSLSEAQCLSLMIYSEYGLDGLVNCYHFDTHPLERLTANRWTWYFFWNSEEMLKIREACSLSL